MVLRRVSRTGDWMRGVTLVAVVAGVAVLIGAAPAYACDYRPVMTVNEVVDAVQRGPSAILGVAEHAVVARAPALAPFTSQRSSFVKTRTWGDAEPTDNEVPVVHQPRSPYFGSLGNSCGAPTTPPSGSTVLVSYMREGQKVGEHTVGPEPFVFHFRDGLTTEMRAGLDAAFGPATAHGIGLADRAIAIARVWWPHTLLTALIVMVLLRRRQRRSIS